MSITAKELPETVTADWLNEYLAKHKIGKADIPTLSVSAQVLVTELFEEMELLSTQAISGALPALNDSLQELTEQLQVIKRECADSAVAESFQPARLNILLERITELNRARINLEAVRDRLTA